MSEFPSQAYTDAQDKWLGRDHLITPTIRKCFGDVLENKDVLDVGCGNGHYSFDFLTWGAAKVVGIDNSEEMIEICNSKKSEIPISETKKEIRFEKADLTNFSISEKFDVVTAFFVLQFLHEKSDLEKAIKNISRHLKTGGILFGLIPNGVEGVDPPEDMGLKLGAQIEKDPKKTFLDGEVVPINFYSDGKICGSSKIALHSREFYEKCFTSSGFCHVEWISPHFTEYAEKLLGDKFCERFLNPPVDIMFKCVKQ